MVNVGNIPYIDPKGMVKVGNEIRSQKPLHQELFFCHPVLLQPHSLQQLNPEEFGFQCLPSAPLKQDINQVEQSTTITNQQLLQHRCSIDPWHQT